MFRVLENVWMLSLGGILHFVWIFMPSHHFHYQCPDNYMTVARMAKTGKNLKKNPDGLQTNEKALNLEAK